jgi:hypothetical protein
MNLKQLFIATICVIVPATALSQTKIISGSGGWGANSKYNALYNRGSSVDFSGTVIGVQREAPMQGMDPGMSLLVKASNGGTATVDLGPAWYVDGMNRKFNLKDRVQVTGSKVFIDGRSVILARKISKGNQVLYLRGEDGFPMWISYRGHVDVVANSTIRGNQTINGTITEIRTMPIGNENNVVIGVQADQGVQWINLGPVWFIGRQDMVLEVGNVIIIDAAPWARAGWFDAWDLRLGDQRFLLRDRFGNPMWQPSNGARPPVTGSRGG